MAVSGLLVSGLSFERALPYAAAAARASTPQPDVKTVLRSADLDEDGFLALDEFLVLTRFLEWQATPNATGHVRGFPGASLIQTWWLHSSRRSALPRRTK